MHFFPIVCLLLAIPAAAELAGTCENEYHGGIPYVVARFADRNLLPATRYLYLVKTIFPDYTEILSPIIPATTRKNNP